MPADRSKVTVSFVTDREPYNIIKMYAAMTGQKLPEVLNEMIRIYATIAGGKIKTHLEKETKQ